MSEWARSSASTLVRWMLARDWSLWLLVAVTLFSLVPRLYGLNWDANTHLHPDERQIVFRSMCLTLPGTPRGSSCDPSYTGPGWLLSPSSPLNPHFFAYGSFPLYLLAVVTHLLAWLTSLTGGRFVPSDGGTWIDFNHFTLVGRVLSALFDTGSVLLTGLLARRLTRAWVAPLAAAFVAFTPFEVQVAHFYAVDTVLLFFVLLTLLACVALAQGGERRPRAAEARADLSAALPAGIWGPWVAGIWVGASFGLAMATKVSALPLLVPISLALALRWRRTNFDQAVLAALGVLGAAVLVFVIVSPYALIDWSEFHAQVTEQTQLSQGVLDYPYVRQFSGTAPYLYPLRQMLLFDIGLPLGVLGIGGLCWAAARLWRSLDDDWMLIVGWVVVYFAVVGGAYTKFSRYMLPIFAPLALCGAAGLAGLMVWGVRRLRVASWQAQLGQTASSRIPDPFASRLARRLVSLWGTSWWRLVCVALGLAVLGSAVFSTLALVNVYSAPNTRVQASQWIYDHVASGSVLTYEVWDDPLPLVIPAARTDASGMGMTPAGHAINPSQYNQIGLNLYDSDTPQKAAELSQQLALANVIVLSSQRLVGSIPKLPDRYPMTTRYYDLLFSGQLGFHLAAHFEAHPHLLGYTLDDSTADESFSVYDHPPVWIFTRTGSGLSAKQINAALTSGVHLPAATNRPASEKSLLLPAANAAAVNASAPLGVQFSPSSLANRVPVLWWLLVVELLGVIAFPLAYLAFPRLIDRGWGLSKLLGPLVAAYLVWISASLRVVPFTALSVVGACALVACASAAVLYFRWRQIGDFVRAHWRVLAVCEACFLAAFALFLWIRALDPDLWHIYRGGEKPMEIAFLDGILRSRYLPPADPWYSGGYINYYYYGQYLVAVLIKLTGIVPTTAFNLALPLLYGLTFTAAFSLVASLTRRVWAGVLAGCALLLVTNLDGLLQLIGQWQAILAGSLPPQFDYWQSSRVIPYVITEFPFWSFLYGDLHAHLIDLPIVVFMLTGCASLVLHGGERMRWRSALPTLGVLALALGTAWCTNTWDVPVFAGLIAVFLALACLPVGRSSSWTLVGKALDWRTIRSYAVAVVVTLGAPYALFLPFHQDYQSFVSGTGPVTTPTAPAQFLTVFGLWLFVVASFFFVELYTRIRRDWPQVFGDRTGPATFWIAAGVWVALLALGTLIGVKVLLAYLMLAGVFLLFDPRHSRARVLTYVLLLAGLAIPFALEFIYLRDFLDNSPWERMNTVFKFYYQAWTLLALGSTLAFVYLLRAARAHWMPETSTDVPTPEPDATPEYPADTADVPGPGVTHQSVDLVPVAARRVWAVLLLALVVACCIFPLEGTQVRVRDPQVWAAVQPPPNGIQPQGLSLDGFAYMYGWYPSDAAAITWMNQHLAGIPTIVEASNGPYQWYGRVSIYTGLPSVLGWSSHEAQQREPGDVYARQADVQQFYGTSDPNQALSFLRQYGVRYIYLGNLERTCYMTDAQNACVAMSQGAQAKLTTLEHAGYLRTVYGSQGVVIYQVVK